MTENTSKKGFTLVELLAALVLFSIMIALVSTVILQIQTAYKSIYATSNLNTQATLITREIENTLRDLPVDHAEMCSVDGNCLIVEKRFEYVIDSVGGSIEVIELIPPISKTITFEEGEIRIDGNNILPDFISLDAGSKIEIITWSNQETIRFSITIIDKSGISYSFIIVHTYPIAY